MNGAGPTTSTWPTCNSSAATTTAQINVDDPLVTGKIGYVNEVQSINLLTNASTTGSWTISFNGYTTAPLPWNATVVQVEQALNSLASISNNGRGSVSVTLPITSMPYYYAVMFQGSLGAQDVPGMLQVNTVNVPAGMTAPRPLVTETTAGAEIGGSIAEATGTGRSLTKAGIGRLIIGSNNLYTGATTITGGILRVTNYNPFGVGPLGTLVDVQGNPGAGQPAALEIDASLVPSHSIVIADKTIELRVPGVQGFATGYLHNYTGMIRNISGDNVITGRVDLRSSDGTGRWVYLGVDSGSLNIAAEISGVDTTGTTYLPGMALAKTGAGKLTFGSTGGQQLLRQHAGDRRHPVAVQPFAGREQRQRLRGRPHDRLRPRHLGDRRPRADPRHRQPGRGQDRPDRDPGHDGQPDDGRDREDLLRAGHRQQRHVGTWCSTATAPGRPRPSSRSRSTGTPTARRSRPL